MNFKEIRKGVEGLEKKRMIVVSEKIPWPDNNGLVGKTKHQFMIVERNVCSLRHKQFWFWWRQLSYFAQMEHEN